MSGEDAKRYGIIDEVIARPPKVAKDLVRDDGVKAVGHDGPKNS